MSIMANAIAALITPSSNAPKNQARNLQPTREFTCLGHQGYKTWRNPKTYN
jgi:hypothetical protein